LIVRAFILLALIGAVALLAELNPPPTPVPPQATRWLKIDAQGKRLSAWGGPWRCVVDTRTGLMWEVKSYAEDLHDKQCSFSWFDGKTGVAKRGDCFTDNQDSDTSDLIGYGNRGNYCGVGGWRLPTEEELRSLLIDNPSPGGLRIAQDYFPYTQRGPYWTADAGRPLTGYFARFGEGAATVHFMSGESRALPYANAAFVRLVTKVVP